MKPTKVNKQGSFLVIDQFNLIPTKNYSFWYIINVRKKLLILKFYREILFSYFKH